MKQYILKKEGEEVARGNEFDLMHYIHKHEPQSLDWCLKYCGYTMEEIII